MDPDQIASGPNAAALAWPAPSTRAEAMWAERRLLVPGTLTRVREISLARGDRGWRSRRSASTPTWWASSVRRSSAIGRRGPTIASAPSSATRHGETSGWGVQIVAGVGDESAPFRLRTAEEIRRLPPPRPWPTPWNRMNPAPRAIVRVCCAARVLIAILLRWSVVAAADRFANGRLRTIASLQVNRISAQRSKGRRRLPAVSTVVAVGVAARYAACDIGRRYPSDRETPRRFL